MKNAQKSSWKSDLVSGFLIFLIALPLCLGIAMASGVPPIAGIITAIIGGILVSFLGSATLTIKGPAAGLIVITLGAVQELGGGDMLRGYKLALAVGVIAAALQIVMALLRVGSLGEMFPSSVVHGMLAAIGVIIFSKQIHLVMGMTPHGKEPLELLREIPHSLMHMNPAIFLIGGASLLVLFLFPLLPWKKIKSIPAPLVVLLIAIPASIGFHLATKHDYNFAGSLHHLGPQYLVQLPGNLLNAIVFPDFSQIWTLTSMKYIVMYSLVGTIESLLSVKAVDALDPVHRESDLNKDLLATGVGNVLASSVGGLPMISEIVRSSANIDAGAKSRMSNFFHGTFLLLFVVLFPSLLKQIPLAALAAMLVYTGLRLASPSEFVKTFQIGSEQLLIFLVTFLTTLATDLLIGVGVGILLKVIIHLRNGSSLKDLFSLQHKHEEEGQQVAIRLQGAAIFTNYLSLRKKLDLAHQSNKLVILDFSEAPLVDHTVMEKIHHLQGEGRAIEIQGLDKHDSLSKHNLSARKKVTS